MRSTITKALPLFFVGLIAAHLSSADLHILQYRYTVLTSGTDFPNFTVVGLLNGAPFVSYNSKSREINLMMTCMKKSEHERHWKSLKGWIQGDEEDLKPFLSEVLKDFNHSEGFHSWQRIFGCELDHNNTQLYDQSCYDGEHVITLDTKNFTWTSASDKAHMLKSKWEATGHRASDHKHDLQIRRQLIQYVSWCRKTLERKVRPETSLFQKHSSSPELVCHATGFFPKALNITWQKDKEDVYEDVELRETLPNQDGSFQKRSILKVPAEELQKHTYTCVIQHSSLEKSVLPVREHRILRGGGSNGVSGRVTIVVIVVLLILFIGFGLYKKQRNQTKRDIP